MSRRRTRRDAHRLRRRRIRTGIAAAALIVLGTVLTFTKRLPFLGSGYELRADFATSGQLVSGDQVRVAGLPAGKVTGVAAGPRHTALVTMQIDRSDLPVHSDATLAIEPRLFLEGSFYVALRPGSSSAGTLVSGATIPEHQTTVPVQFDQVLDVFDAPVRLALRATIAQLSTALDGAGAGGLRSTVRQFADALPSATQVEQAAQGTAPGDLTHLVTASAASTGQLAEDPAALARIVTDTDRVAGALAAHTAALSGTIIALDHLVRVAPGSLTALHGALPALSTLAGQLRPALRAAPGPLRDTSALLTQLDALVRPRVLPALVTALRPAVDQAPALERMLGTLGPLVTRVSECVSTHIVPVLNEQVPDGSLSTGAPAWLDFLHAGTGLTGLSSDFDANGVAVRAGLTVGDSTVTAFVPQLGTLVGTATHGLEGVDPEWLGNGVTPPHRPDAPCTTQALPDLGARRTPGSGGLTVAPARAAGTASTADDVLTLMRHLLGSRR
ncbi:MAG TPA: MlaD family protein [Solirubrobacteraceae bacterium]|nr:MlaD family protein [Solirubrobacteraceae bacterium]